MKKSSRTIFHNCLQRCGIRYLLKAKLVISVIAVLAIASASSAVILYTDTWPPVYAVQSMSMEHAPVWTAGTINTGDLVFVKAIHDNPGNVVTYVQGRQTGFKSYGDYGNVILFEDPSGKILIHRAMFYLSWNGDTPVVSDSNNQSWIIVTPSSVVLEDVGYKHRNLIVHLTGMTGNDGYITAGDYNVATSNLYNTTYNAYIAADQNAFGFGPVKPSSVVGKAFGDIPWFGLIKLNIMKLGGEWPEYNQVPSNAYLYLAISILAIFVVTFFPYRKTAAIFRRR